MLLVCCNKHQENEDKRWMIRGATVYTAQLIIEELIQRVIEPIIIG
jgi:short subunit dehydrogenase-like uncharacterized protein